MGLQRIEFGRREAASSAGCACGHGDGGCMCGDSRTATPTDTARSTADVELRVAGMTCDHCVRAVTEELLAVDGVTAVDVRLVPDGVSGVSVGTTGPVAPEALAAAIGEAGYALADV